MTGGDGTDTFVYRDVGDEPIEITDFDPTVDTMAIQFHENDVRDISVHPVSEDVNEIRLGDQVAAYITSTVPFDASSIMVQAHHKKLFANLRFFSIRGWSVKTDSSKGLAGRHPGSCHNP